jgi:hypothetical protein
MISACALMPDHWRPPGRCRGRRIAQNSAEHSNELGGKFYWGL